MPTLMLASSLFLTGHHSQCPLRFSLSTDPPLSLASWSTRPICIETWKSLGAMQQRVRVRRDRSIIAQPPCLRSSTHIPRPRLPWVGVCSFTVLFPLLVVLGKPYLNKSLAHYHLYLGLFGGHGPRQLSLPNNQLRN